MRTASQQHGFTITQMVVTLAIIAVVSTFGVLGIKNARAEFRLHNSARLFASYVEKARADSIRRHAAEGSESSVEIFGAGTTAYAVTMDWGGGIETRTFNLDDGLEFATDAQKVTFNWRGRITVPCDITKACVFQVHSNYLEYSVPVDVSVSGDITVGSQVFPDLSIPEIALGPTSDGLEPSPTPTPSPSPSPSGEASPSPSPQEGASPSPSPSPTESASPTPSPTASPTATPHGNGNDGNNGNGNPNASPTATPVASPSPVAQCVSTLSQPSLSLSQTDPTKLTGTVTFTMMNATGVRIISASQVGNGNSLGIGLSQQRIDGSGSSIVSITTKQGGGNRGTFLVQVSADPACGSAQQLSVTVSN